MSNKRTIDGKITGFESEVECKKKKNFSQRAFDGNLIVENNHRCPKCGHHKKFIGNNIKKCTRCKYEY